MKVAIEVTVDIDEEAWAEAYGLDPKDVRSDVKEHSKHLLFGVLEGLAFLR